MSYLLPQDQILFSSSTIIENSQPTDLIRSFVLDNQGIKLYVVFTPDGMLIQSTLFGISGIVGYDPTIKDWISWFCSDIPETEFLSRFLTPVWDPEIAVRDLNKLSVAYPHHGYELSCWAQRLGNDLSAAQGVYTLNGKRRLCQLNIPVEVVNEVGVDYPSYESSILCVVRQKLRMLVLL